MQWKHRYLTKLKHKKAKKSHVPHVHIDKEIDEDDGHESDTEMMDDDMNWLDVEDDIDYEMEDGENW